VLIGLNEKPKH